MPSLTINGRVRELDCSLETPLLLAIREGAGLAGTPFGCLIGMCGACTVHVDGQPVRSCGVTLEQAQGRTITTIEGVMGTDLGRALVQAWTRLAVSPCGHCRPGQIMAAAALLAKNPLPSDGDIDAALADHVCDCADRGNLHLAVHEAARGLAA